jgi:hypothetical protein
MKRICAFCNRDLSPHTGDDDKISHGICSSCYNHVKASMGVDLKEYLNMLDRPVVLVDKDLHVLTANWKAHQFTDKEEPEMLGKLPGEVFECENAKLPEGCGHTVHCSGCVIRNSVNFTFQTGNPVNQHPAVLNQGVSGFSFPVDLLISTQKSGDVVLLKVEHISNGNRVLPLQDP